MTDEEFCEKLKKAATSYPTMKQACDSLEMHFGTFKRLTTKLGVYIPNMGGKSVPDEIHRLNADAILVRGVKRGRYHLVRALQEKGVEYRCAECGCEPRWNEKPLTLPVDHIDGDHSNNEFSNLRFLCPNCHSQTPTHGFKRHHSEETKQKIRETVRKHYAGVAQLVDRD